MLNSISETPSQMTESPKDDELLTTEIVEGPLQVILEEISLINPNRKFCLGAPEILEKPKRPGTW